MWEVSWHKQRTHVHYSLVPLQRFDLARHHSCTKHVRLDDFKLGSHSSHDTLNYSISRRCKCTWPVYTQEMTTTLTHLNLFEVPPWLMTSCQRVLPLRYRPRSWRYSDLESEYSRHAWLESNTWKPATHLCQCTRELQELIRCSSA